MIQKIFSKLFFTMLFGVGLFCIAIYMRQISPGWGIDSIGKIIMVYLVCEAAVRVSENLFKGLKKDGRKENP